MRQTAAFTIRQVHLSDLPALYRICLQTGQHGKDATGQVDEDILGHVFVGPYAVLEPSLSFLLTMNGDPVGYIVGTADTHRFASDCERNWWPVLRQRYPLPPSSDQSRTAAMIREIHRPGPIDPIANDYPAHLHINILPPGQGLGHGRHLIDTFMETLSAEGGRALHFGVSGRNTSAIAFYRHLGFEELGKADWGVQMGRRL